jgi:riboflavin transporter FmnP
MESKKSLFSTRELVIIGLFSALAYVLMLLESPGYLGFLRIELSDVPAILGSLGLGPAAGVFIELIKNIIKVMSTKTIGAGELANFVVGSAYVLPVGIIYRKWKGKNRFLVGYTVATVAMCVAGMLINYFVTLPLYSNMFGGTEALIGYVAGMTPGFLPEINSLWKIIIIGITPFNVVKGIIIAVVSYYVFKLVKKPLQF